MKDNDEDLVGKKIKVTREATHGFELGEELTVIRLFMPELWACKSKWGRIGWLTKNDFELL